MAGGLPVTHVELLTVQPHRRQERKHASGQASPVKCGALSVGCPTDTRFEQNTHIHVNDTPFVQQERRQKNFACPVYLALKLGPSIGRAARVSWNLSYTQVLT